MTKRLPSYVSEITLPMLGGAVPTRVLTGGQGDPLVFLHGAGGLSWGPPLDGLAGWFRVYAPEHPGSSDPDASARIRDIREVTRFYDELLDALGLDSTVLVGHSFGGMVAAELAACRTGRISKLVLIAPVGLWRDDAPVAGIPPQQLPATSVAEPHDPAAITTAHLTWPISDKGLRRRLHRVRAPTLLVWGTQVKLPPDYADDFAALLPDARIELVPGTGNFPHLEAPASTHAILVRFLIGRR
jgi:pimeloyl-ACP methyl ester carboxylesterase